MSLFYILRRRATFTLPASPLPLLRPRRWAIPLSTSKRSASSVNPILNTFSAKKSKLIPPVTTPQPQSLAYFIPPVLLPVLPKSEPAEYPAALCASWPGTMCRECPKPRTNHMLPCPERRGHSPPSRLLLAYYAESVECGMLHQRKRSLDIK